MFFKKLILTNPIVLHITHVLDSNDCKQCPKVLAEIEHIDDDADDSGINFVKIDDRQMAKDFGVFALPAVLFFKMGSKDPVIYAGKVYFVVLMSMFTY